MVDLIAFVDESRKPMRDRATGKVSDQGYHYVVAAAIVIAEDAEIGAAVLDIENRLGYSLHYADLRSKERKLAAVDEVAELEGWDGYVFETSNPVREGAYTEHHVRAKLLNAVFVDLSVDAGVSSVTLETRAGPHEGFAPHDAMDRAVLQKLQTDKAVKSGLKISHADKTEPLLAIADIVAGARSDFLCLAEEEAYGHIGHRVRSTKAAFAP